MKKRSILLLVFILAILTTGCYESTPDVEEQYGKATYDPEKKQIAFFKGFEILYNPLFNKNKKQKTAYKEVKLYTYNIQTHELEEILNLKTLDNWPSQWKTKIKWEQDYILFNLKNLNEEKKEQGKYEGFYFYDLNKKKVQQINSNAENFWLSPPKDLMLYITKTEDKYNLFSYNLNKGTKNKLNSNIPKIEGLKWLKDGEAALIYESVADSALKINIDQPERLKKIKSPVAPEKKDKVLNKELVEIVKPSNYNQWNVPVFKIADKNNNEYSKDLIKLKGNNNYRSAVAYKLKEELKEEEFVRLKNKLEERKKKAIKNKDDKAAEEYMRILKIL
jgi:hypothetical protein